MRFLILTVFFILLRINVFSQGCSDAGFCTMGAMRPNQGYSKKINLTLRSIEVSQYFGLTSFYLKILAYNADINIGITPKLTAQIKLPYQFVFGHLANTSGMGDISISATYNIIGNEDFQINASLGGKIPTNNSNFKASIVDTNGNAKDLSLPMYYQTSLGSWDGIAGVSLITKDWLFATGIQYAFTQNGNEFLWGPWNATYLGKDAGKYPKSKFLKRGTDVMLRIERNLRFSNWNVYVGLLGIYRITKDEFTEPGAAGLEGKRAQVSTKNFAFSTDIGTNNLAATLLFGGGYRFSTKSAIKLTIGYQLVGRKSYQFLRGKEVELDRNPDGLSRLLVTNVGYEYRF